MSLAKKSSCLYVVPVPLCSYVQVKPHTLQGGWVELEDTPCLCVCVCLIDCVRVRMFGVYLFGYMCVIIYVFCAVLLCCVRMCEQLSSPYCRFRTKFNNDFTPHLLALLLLQRFNSLLLL